MLRNISPKCCAPPFSSDLAKDADEPLKEGSSTRSTDTNAIEVSQPRSSYISSLPIQHITCGFQKLPSRSSVGGCKAAVEASKRESEAAAEAFKNELEDAKAAAEAFKNESEDAKAAAEV